MSEESQHTPTSKSDTTLRILVLGTIYALAVFFVVALSPSMGFVTPHPTGEVGRVAEAPDTPKR